VKGERRKVEGEGEGEGESLVGYALLTFCGAHRMQLANDTHSENRIEELTMWYFSWILGVGFAFHLSPFTFHLSPLLIPTMLVFVDQFIGHGSPHHLISPAGVHQHDRQKHDGNPKRDAQRQMACAGIPDRQTAARRRARYQQEREQAETDREQDTDQSQATGYECRLAGVLVRKYIGGSQTGIGHDRREQHPRMQEEMREPAAALFFDRFGQRRQAWLVLKEVKGER
jgi:Membrane bound YbgT-like protein.